LQPHHHPSYKLNPPSGLLVCWSCSAASEIKLADVRNPQSRMTHFLAAQLLRAEPELAYFHTFRERSSPAALAAGAVPARPRESGNERGSDLEHGMLAHAERTPLELTCKCTADHVQSQILGRHSCNSMQHTLVMVQSKGTVTCLRRYGRRHCRAVGTRTPSSSA
jgi:hypothetical protein